MEEKSFKINVPSGYEIDKENSTFEEIKFKKIESKYPKSWGEAFMGRYIEGYYINDDSNISPADGECDEFDMGIFKTQKQAKSALAYAQLTQLMALPCYNGYWVPDWGDLSSLKYVLYRKENDICLDAYWGYHHPITFKSADIRDAFLKNHEDLLRQYFELD